MRLWLLRAFALLGGVLFLAVVGAGFAGWYTSRPQFCASCHIMEPYYRSWQTSTHHEVTCIECHFSPGFGGEVRGKMLGLVQLAKYVTASEGPRPAAEIPDDSCLRSGCHETRLLSGKVNFHGVPFDHTPHLGDLRRGKKLRCTSCHSQIVQGAHMAVTTSTCFLCHFKGESFNEDLGACTRCHQIPDEKFDLGGGVMFSHDLAYEKGVDCVNCHGDLIRGEGEVPKERCVGCHNVPEDLARINDHEFLHQKHVTDHRIDCMECHLEIQHSLDRDKIAHAASDCASCHPGHHHEQVSMLQGTGGRSIPAHAGGMTVTRIECRTCHQVKEVSPTGTVLWRASAEVCLKCHDPSAADRLEAYYKSLQGLLLEIEPAIPRLREALTSAKLPDERAAAVTAELDDLQHDLEFVRAANGVHNIHYASTLIRTLLERLSSLSRELKTPEPQVKPPAQFNGLK